MASKWSIGRSGLDDDDVVQTCSLASCHDRSLGCLIGIGRCCIPCEGVNPTWPLPGHMNPCRLDGGGRTPPISTAGISRFIPDVINYLACAYRIGCLATWFFPQWAGGGRRLLLGGVQGWSITRRCIGFTAKREHMNNPQSIIDSTGG